MENRTREYETHDSKLTLTTALCILDVLNKQIPRAVNLINDQSDKQTTLAINQISYARANIEKAITQLNNAINNIG